MTLSPAAEDRIRRELEDGEELVWAAQPVAGAYARQAWPIGLFGIPFFLFAIFWMVGAGAGVWFSGSGAQPAGTGQGLFVLFPLFGIPFVLVGLFLVTAPVRERVKARRVVYGITDRRAITITPRFMGEEVKSYMPDDLATITRRERRDGTGDIIFGEYRGIMTAMAHGNRNGLPQLNTPGFVGVREAREVERVVRALARAGKA